MHHYSEDIARLKTLCTFPSEDYCNRSYSFKEHEKARLISMILVKSELIVPELNRGNVASLMKGDLKWPGKDGEDQTITNFDDIELLERLGLISFYGGWLRVHYCLSDMEDKVHDSAMSLYRVMRDLYGIIFGNDKYTKPQFSSGLEIVNEILGRYDPDEIEELRKKGKKYYLDVESSSLKGLIFSYLWEFLCEENNGSDAMSQWLLFSGVYRNDWSPDFSILNEELKDVFIKEGLNRLEADPQLKVSPEVLLRQFSYRHSKGSMFYHCDQVVKVNIDLSGGGISRDVGDPADSEMTLFTLDEIKNDVFNIGNFDGLIDYCEHWKSLLNSHEYGEWYCQSYYGIPNEIVNANLRVSSNSIDEYGGVGRLVSLSHNSAFMKHVIFYLIPHSGNFDYFIYLLFNEDTSVLGYKLLLDQVEEEFSRSRFSNDLVVTNTINLACKIFLSCGFDGRLDDISRLLISMARAAVRYGENDSYSFAKESLTITLGSFSLNQIAKLMDSLLDGLSSENQIGNSAGMREWKFYLLFWVLEKSQNYGIESDKYDSPKIQRMIIEEYSASFNECLDRGRYSVDAVEIFQYFPWKRITDKCSIGLVLDLVSDPSKWMKKYLDHEASNYYSGLKFLKSYAQILILLDSGVDEVSAAIRRLARDVGFEFEDYRNGIFNDGISSGYYLWELFSSWLEQLSEQRFSDLLADIENVMPLDFLLNLYRTTFIQSRKKIIKEGMFKKACEVSNLGLASLEYSLDVACMEGMRELAGAILRRGLDIISERLSDKNNYYVSEIRTRWDGYEYKVRLLELAAEKNTVEERLDLVRKLEEPFRRVSAHSGIEYNQKVSCNQFKRSVIAGLLYEVEPELSVECFDNLYKETKNFHYASSMFAARIELIKASGNEVLKYRHALSDWLLSIEGRDVSELNDGEICNWFYCLQELEEFAEIDSLWLRISQRKRMNVDIANNYCMSLKDRGRDYEARKIYLDLKQFHNVEELNEEVEREILDLGERIIGDQEPMLIHILTDRYANKPKSSDELKRSYDEIFSTSKSLSEIVGIVSGESVDEFLYSGLMRIMGEIQLRKKNIQNHNKRDGKNSRIVGEDLINDWVTSLFNRQYAYMGLSCRDQARGGQSESQKTPGEIDFFLCDNRNDRMSIMEAFRLFSNDTTVINTHLNKISGYDQECLGVVFIIGYCDVADFSGLCRKYEVDTNDREYVGFNRSCRGDDKLIVREDSDTIKGYREVRYRGNKPVTIFHLMLNLRFAS